MSQEMREGGPDASVRHEPIVSETLKESAEQHRREAEAAPPARPNKLEQQEEPLKHHGDALRTGTGTRHGAGAEE